MDNQGNMLLLTILAVLFLVGGVGYLLIKYRRTNAMNQAIQQKDYEKILELCEQDRYKTILGPLVCDLYRFNALRSLGKIDELKQALDTAVQLYGGRDQEKILELYYHYFLNHGDHTYAQKLLNDIRDTGNEPFILCSEWSYQVIAQGRNDLFNDMEDAINNDTFKGASLGTVLYLMGLQLEKDNDLEQAKGYFETATQCFLPSAIYMTLCHRHMDAIDAQMDRLDEE